MLGLRQRFVCITGPAEPTRGQLAHQHSGDIRLHRAHYDLQIVEAEIKCKLSLLFILWGEILDHGDLENTSKKIVG